MCLTIILLIIGCIFMYVGANFVPFDTDNDFSL